MGAAKGFAREWLAADGTRADCLLPSCVCTLGGVVLQTTETYCLPVVEAGSPQSRPGQGQFLLMAVREGVFQASLLGWERLSVPCVFMLSSLHACLSL